MEKILVADDEESFLALVASKLQKEGYQVVTAANGDEAIQKAKTENPDLIILDILMPYRDGLNTSVVLDGDEQTRGIPIIFLTALEGDKKKEGKDSQIGGHFVIDKAVNLDVLMAKMRALLDAHSKGQ